MIDAHNENTSPVSEPSPMVETEFNQETVEEALQNYRDQNMQFLEERILPSIEDDDTDTESTSEEEDGIEETEEVHADSEVEGEASDEDERKRLEEMEKKNAADIAAFRKLPFIDLYTKHAELVKQRDQMKSIKGMVDQMKSGSFPGADMQIPLMNALDENGQTDQSAKEFLDQYDDLMAEAERAIQCAETVLGEYEKETVNSSQFLANSLCESIENKIDELDKSNHTNKKFIIKRMETIRDAYEDRTDYSYLFNKLRYYYNIQAAYKNFTKLGGDGVIKYLDKTFGEVFNDPKMGKFLAEVTTMVDPVYNLYDVTFFTYWLATIYEKEYASGNFSHPKTLIMNVYDIITGVYDLPGGKDAVIETIKTMFALLMTFALLKKKSNVSKKAVEKQIDDFYNMVMKQYHEEVDPMYYVDTEDD